jgi:hypothetical protein
MNVAQAKQLSLPDILARLDRQPAREAKGEYWYLSPFRQEETPSFKIDHAGKLWYDFGEGAGGGIIEFAQKYWKCSVAEALRHLSSLYPGSLLESATPAARPSLPLFEAKSAITSDTIEVTSIEPLKSRALIGYLGGRGIDFKTAQAYVQEIHFTNHGKPYFALAFANDSGGYDLRNKYYKGTHGAKDITVLRPVSGEASEVAVFEGFIDYLSALVHFGASLAETPVIVLNGVPMKERGVEAIRQMGVSTAHLYLDNDSAGHETAEYFREQLPGVNVLDQSGLYAQQKDFNEWLVAGRAQVRSR